MSFEYIFEKEAKKMCNYILQIDLSESTHTSN